MDHCSEPAPDTGIPPDKSNRACMFPEQDSLETLSREALFQRVQELQRQQILLASRYENMHKAYSREYEITTNLILKITAQNDLRESIRALGVSLQSWSGCEAVGIRLRNGDDYPYYETCGFPPAFVEAENHLCDYGMDGDAIRDHSGNPILECMCGNILQRRFDATKPFFTPNGSFWTNNTTALLASTTEADRQARTRNRCNGEGYESVALIPLRAGEEVFGLLQFNDHRTGRFTPDQITLLERIADNLAIALSRRQTEEALRQSEERYQRITRAITDYIYTVKVANGHVVETVHGPGCLAVTGYSPDEFASNPYLWFQMVAMEDRTAVEEQARQILEGNEPPPLEHRILHQNGSTRWVRNTFIPNRNREGTLITYDGLIQDITERKLAEAALRESEEKLSMALEASNAGAWEWNPGTGTVHFDERFHAMLGYAPGDLPDTIEAWRTYHHPEDAPAFYAKIDAYLHKIIPFYESELRIRSKSGDWVWLFTRGRIVRLTEPETRELFIGIAFDITHRKQTEAEKDKLVVQLQQAQKMESVGRLAGGVAHDFNNMLQVILNHTSIAMDQTDTQHPLYFDLEEIRKAAERSAGLTRQLLAFARKQAVSPIILNLNEIIGNMLKMLQRLIGEDITLAWLPGNALWPVRMDASQVDQIMANLCVNARDAISGVGRVSIETGNATVDTSYCETHSGFMPGNYIVLSVSDNGCGMDKQTRSQLFEPFFTTKEQGKGTGLGLATVYGIVKQNNGFINTYSEPGQGTTFRIYLPRHGDNPEAFKVENERNLQKPAILRGHETILLVEDEHGILSVIKRILETLGYQILASTSPIEALHIAQKHPAIIHLLMTDIIMPEMNGRELAQKLVALHPRIKSLFMSGYTADIIAHHGVLEDGVEFIQKPFSTYDLTVKIREVLDKAE